MSDTPKEQKQLKFKVGRTTKKRRIDKYLHDRLSNLSRVMVQKQIAAGAVRVNGKVVKASFKISMVHPSLGFRVVHFRGFFNI